MGRQKILGRKRMRETVVNRNWREREKRGREEVMKQEKKIK